MSSLAISFLNFFILVGFLGYKLKQPVRDFTASRHRTLKHEMQSVQEQLKIAQDKYDEFSAKLRALSAEVAILNEQTKQDAAAMTQRILSDARRLASTLLSDAKNSADGLMTDLKRDLYAELSTKVLDRAEIVLRERLTRDDQNRIQKEFSKQMERVR